ncbi:MAG TPA: Uma2 family endonuclease [Chloroflexi bacterium]|nr:Uma2 family endonuclease [Chloroflexota bacterium]
MSVVVEKLPLFTGEDLLEMGDIGPAELIEGEIIRMSPTQNMHGWLVMELARRLGNFNAERRLGWVLGAECGLFTHRNPDTVRGMDVAFISKQRLSTLPPGFLEVAPELVVEIVSPSDRWDSIRRKIAEYFAVGVERVWVVEPAARKVLVFRAVTEFSELSEGDVLRGEGVLRGFELPLAELFAE